MKYAKEQWILHIIDANFNNLVIIMKMISPRYEQMN
jgi:hypothetical protein